MTGEDTKQVAQQVIKSLSGAPALLLVGVVLLASMVVFFFDSAETRKRIVQLIEGVEKNRHDEVMGCLETVRTCQDDLAATKGVMRPTN